MLHGGVPEIGAPVVVHVGKIRTHAGERRSIGSVGDARPYAHFFEPFAADVVKQKIWRGVVGDESVEKSVAVVVAERNAHAFSRRRNAGFPRNIGERAIAIIAVERVMQRRVVVRMAVGAHPVPDRAVGILVDLPYAIVHHK